MITVRNFKDSRVGEYIGRANKYYNLARSPLANPFPLSKYTREQSIDAYRHWLWKQIQSGNRAVLAELDRLSAIWHKTGELVLVCWCAPLACHGDVVKACLEWMATQPEYLLMEDAA